MIMSISPEVSVSGLVIVGMSEVASDLGAGEKLRLAAILRQY